MKEYKQLTMIHTAEIATLLNRLAKDGWRYVAYIPAIGNSLAYLLVERQMKEDARHETDVVRKGN